MLSTRCTYACLFSLLGQKSRMGNRSQWLWWFLGLGSTSWCPCDMELPWELSFYFCYAYVKTMWWYYSWCNKHLWWYFCNLSAYVCDWSLGTHKIMHPILSLNLGVINWYQSHVDCRASSLVSDGRLSIFCFTCSYLLS